MAPTILSLLRVSVPASMQGRSLTSDTSEAGESAIYARLDLEDRRSAVLISHPGKLLRRDGKSSLFNLRQDPMEKTDLAKREVERVAALETRLAARGERNARHRAQLGAGQPTLRGAELPLEAQRALEALGYLDEGDAERGD